MKLLRKIKCWLGWHEFEAKTSNGKTTKLLYRRCGRTIHIKPHKGNDSFYLNLKLPNDCD